MKRVIAFLMIIFILFTNPISYGESYLDRTIDDEIRNSLRSYILGDFKSGQVLEEYNIEEVVELASISKMMSYIVIMDAINNGSISLEDNILIDKDITRIKGSSFKLKIGEEFSVEELLKASMVISGNDATYALARYIAGTEEEFVNMMNIKAKSIGLINSIFYNSTGLPVEGQDVQNKMTTKELFELTRYILKNYPEILDITTIKFIDIPSREFFQRNTNPLLGETDGVDGLKTGFTNKAGYCYVSTFNIQGDSENTKDMRLISIVMGAKDIVERNTIAKRLVEDAIENYSYRIFLDKNMPLGNVEFPKGHIETTEIFPEKGFEKLISKDENINMRIVMEEGIDLPVYSNNSMGKVFLEEDGEIIFETNVIIKESIVKAKWYILLGRLIKSWIDMLFNG